MAGCSWRIVLWGLFIWCVLVNPVVAQVSVHSVATYTTENMGLSHNTVLNMMQDRTGFIWISTMDGLNKFDGKRMHIYRHNPADSSTLSNSFVHGVTEDKDGNLWIGTRDGGVNILNPVTDTIHRIEYQKAMINGISESPVSVIFNDSHGYIWIGFFSGTLGFYNLEEKRFQPAYLQHADTNEPIQSVNALMELNDGSILISSYSGVFYIAPEAATHFRNNPDSVTATEVVPIPVATENPHPNSNIMHIDSEGGFWVEQIGKDPLLLVDQQFLPPTIRESIASGQRSSSVENSIVERGQYFMKGVSGGALLVVNNVTKDQQMYTVSEGEFKGGSKLFEDNEGRIWFYTWGGGFQLLQERTGITHISLEHGLPSDFILGFADEGESTWVATNKGLALARANGEVVSYQNKIIGFNDDSIWSVFRDSLGLWMGTRHDGLFFIPDVELAKAKPVAQRFTVSNSFLPMNNVPQVFRDSRGWLWLGFEGAGIVLVKNVEAWLAGNPANITALSNTTGEKPINSRSIRKVYEDADGNIWLATTDNGYNYLTISDGIIQDVTMFERNDTDFSLPHKDARSIYQKNDSTFWFASYGGGLTKWIKGTKALTTLRTNDGLANNSVYGILPDQNERFLWASTNNGLSRLDTETQKFTNFTVVDGLQNNEFNTGAYHQKKNGIVLFGGVNGFNVIDTRKLILNTSPPAVKISEIQLFNEPLDADTAASYMQEIKLMYNQNFLSFEYVALDYNQPLSVQYAHKMMGVDEDWVYTKNRNFADYPGLKPGEYLFLVKAANGDGFWNEEGAQLRIIIRPPWWQTWWFRLAAIIVLIGLFVAVIRYFAQRRLKEQIRKMEVENRLRNERERISRDLHDHVGAQLANIMSGLSLVDKYSEFEEIEKASTLLKSLRGDAQLTIKQLRETIWALNQNELTIEKFVEHVRLYFNTQSALQSSLSLTIVCNAGGDNMLSSAQALNLFRIIQEAAQNTLKYAEASKLDITFTQEGERITVSVKDDGTFKAPKNSFNEGFGMKNMKKRAREINANIELTTSSGTEIAITFELEN